MEAVIVAGGLGSRLMPLTKYTPKHLLPVAGVPFVVHQIVKLARAGASHIVLATSYQAAQFEPVLGDGSHWGVELTFVTEVEPLGTGGAIRNVTPHLHSGADDPVVILNGDILSGHDLAAQYRRHREAAADATLHLVAVADARAYGCVPTDGGGRVVAFIEKTPDPPSKQINAGCYIFARRVIDEIPVDAVVSAERETFPALLASGRLVLGYVDDSYWIDVGTPASLCRSSVDLVRGMASSPAYDHEPSVALVAESADVHSRAVVTGGSSVGPGARIGSGAVIDGSVVYAGAILDDAVSVVDSVVGPEARVGSGTTLRDAVVGDRATVGAGCELHGGIRVACDADLASGSVRFSP